MERYLQIRNLCLFHNVCNSRIIRGEINNYYNTFEKLGAIRLYIISVGINIPTSSTCRLTRDGGSQRFRLDITTTPGTYRNHYRGALL